MSDGWKCNESDTLYFLLLNSDEMQYICIFPTRVAKAFLFLSYCDSNLFKIYLLSISFQFFSRLACSAQWKMVVQPK